MKTKFGFLLFSFFGLSACFSSSALDDDPCGPNPCFGIDVESCAGQTNCEELAWCGTTIYCDFEDPVPPIPPPVTCTDPRPVCADSVEVSSCDGWDTCFSSDWCGMTLYCASNGCEGVPPRCGVDEEMSNVPCSAGELGCTDHMACGAAFACRPSMDCSDPIFEPCSDAISEVYSIGSGECPDLDRYVPCYDNFYCGAQHYCITACPQGGEEVAHPSECENANDCYSVDHGLPELVWCQGAGPLCRAIPTCNGGEEIPLDEECNDDFGTCEYRTVCSTTIQCYFYDIVVG